METSIIRIEIKYEHDVVLARQRARLISQLIGFDAQDQVRIATTVSELARNAFQYAGGGKVEFSFSACNNALVIQIKDSGPGFEHLDIVLGGNYQSQTGMGLGITGARRLMDHFDIKTSKNGTLVTLEKKLPKTASAPTSATLSMIAGKLAKQDPYDPFQEIQCQNQELLSALDEVQQQRTSLTSLNQELEETNRGVVALYAELDERADYLKRASELKTQFLSNMTHEFRTPLNSILSISDMLLKEMDGFLNSEQKKQVGFIQAGAKSLSDLVNDLLDIAKVEAGKVIIRPAEFEVSDMFQMLRGMLRPLVESTPAVELIFEKPHDIPPLRSDEGKISQILRNFVSNGLKYTKKGEVRVSVQREGDDYVRFSVRDTGMGIAACDQKLIFEEFSQVEGTHQHKIKGTGLGLPLSKKLAQLLGGKVLLESAIGKGSVFSVILPLSYRGEEEVIYDSPSFPLSEDGKILIIDDNPADRYVIRKLLSHYSNSLVEAQNGTEGMSLAETIQPCAIILDLSMPEIGGEAVLKQLKRNKSTSHIPVIIHTSRQLSPSQHKTLLTKARAIIAKGSAHQKALLDQLESILYSPNRLSTGMLDHA